LQTKASSGKTAMLLKAINQSAPLLEIPEVDLQMG